MAPRPPDGTRTLQICGSCGGGAPVDVHFCPQCTKVLGLGRHGDFFSFLGVPRKLRLDAADLERRYRSLSRQFHPDFFYNATPAERRASLERTSYLNDAYRTLKDPISRIAYLLEMEGGRGRESTLEAEAHGSAVGSGGGAPRRGEKVPPALLEEVFALNEELDEVRDLKASGAPPTEWQARLEEARRPIDARRGAHEAEIADLSARWDALVDRGASAEDRRPVLDALAERMLERNYISNLLAGIERELAA